MQKKEETKKGTTTKKTPVVRAVIKKTLVVKGTDFAVIMTGGKQYQVFAGEYLKVEKISDNLKAGDKIFCDKVLLTDDGSKTVVGSPTISGAKVSAEVMEVGRADKVTVIKYKQKSRYFKKRGHRQPYTKVMILEVK